MEIMIKIEDYEHDDVQIVKQSLEQIPGICFETIEEDGIDAVSVLFVIIGSGTLAAVIKAVEKIYSARIKSINEQQYYVKVDKNGVEVKAPSLDHTKRLLREAIRYKEKLDSNDQFENISTVLLCKKRIEIWMQAAILCDYCGKGIIIDCKTPYLQIEPMHSRLPKILARQAVVKQPRFYYVLTTIGVPDLPHFAGFCIFGLFS